jgi:hypothetical protein
MCRQCDVPLYKQRAPLSHVSTFSIALTLSDCTETCYVSLEILIQYPSYNFNILVVNRLVPQALYMLLVFTADKYKALDKDNNL